MNNLTSCSSKQIPSSSLLFHQTGFKQQGLIYRNRYCFMLHGEPLEMQHGTQLGCPRFTTQQTGPEVERQRCRHTRKHTCLSFTHLITLTNYTKQPILTHSCCPSHCVHCQLCTSDHNRADWVAGVGTGCGKDGCAADQRLGEDEVRKWSNDKSRLHTDVHAEAKVKPQNIFLKECSLRLCLYLLARPPEERKCPLPL